MDAITKPPDQAPQTEPESPGLTPKLIKEINYYKEGEERANEEIQALNDELKEAGDMIKVMDGNMTELNSELKRLKIVRSESGAEFAKKESEFEQEITELCEEVTTYRRMAEDKAKELTNFK
jgi:chromosome segregation ATPase